MPLYQDFVTPDKLNLDVSAIEDAIKNILLTPLGSLPGKPEFGSRLRYILFENMDGITEHLAKTVIQEALAKWETRIMITGTDISPVPEFNKYIIKISYRFADSELNYNTSISLDFVS